MKKFLYAFIAFNLLLASCSEDENDSSITEVFTLPKTIKTTYPDFPQENTTATLKYDGNKVIDMVNETTKTKFTYNGDLIVKQETYNIGLQGVETIRKRILYAYENGKLKTKISTSNFDSNHPDGDYIRKEVYTYKTDGTISYSQIDVNPQTDAETKRGDVNLTFKSGNLIKLEETHTDPTFPTTVFTFEYDDKNNPLKNIIGFNLILANYSVNNITKKATIIGGSNSPAATYNSTYIYNTNGYPTKHTAFTSDGKTQEYITEYTY